MTRITLILADFILYFLRSVKTRVISIIRVLLEFFEFTEPSEFEQILIFSLKKIFKNNFHIQPNILIFEIK